MKKVYKLCITVPEKLYMETQKFRKEQMEGKFRTQQKFNYSRIFREALKKALRNALDCEEYEITTC